ncbi:zinc finger protein 883-like [Lethenteron reissneri]|uniref:zinc finger protein 883-like n=1 Tax=Lethenteron reissneri TaxID=7753 RepID=UPI002AB78A1B|nr:zinc finger protein 883-like [Lethenteron reissneri]
MKIFCPICKWLVVSLPALDDHMKRHRGWTEPALFRCPHCPFNTDKLNVFIGHQATHDVRESHKCAECGKVFIDAEVFREHQAAHAEEKPYKCTDCELAFNRSEDLHEHQKTHAGGKPYHCTVCGMDFTRSEQLRNHQRIHTGEKPYRCAECDKIFARFDTLVAHLRVHEGGRARRCAVCGKECADFRALHVHQNVHGLPSRPPSSGGPEGASVQTFDAPVPCGNGGGEPRRRRTSGGGGGDRSFSTGASADAERNGAKMKIFCPICKWLVVSLPALDDHMKRHRGWTEPALFRCPHCLFNTDKLNVFIGHQATHDVRESHKCAECGKVFIDAEVFREHQAAHAEEKPYKCTDCELAFNRSEDLHEHQKTHADGKPYHCTVCGMDFTRSEQLRNHQRIHTGEKPYRCAECDKIFARFDTLVAHLRVHEGGRARRCAVCGKECADFRALHVHQNVHGLPSRPPSSGGPEGASVQTFDAPVPCGNGGGEPRRRRTSGGGGGDRSFSTGARQCQDGNNERGRRDEDLLPNLQLGGDQPACPGGPHEAAQAPDRVCAVPVPLLPVQHGQSGHSDRPPEEPCRREALQVQGVRRSFREFERLLLPSDHAHQPCATQEVDRPTAKRLLT